MAKVAQVRRNAGWVLLFGTVFVLDAGSAQCVVAVFCKLGGQLTILTRLDSGPSIQAGAGIAVMDLGHHGYTLDFCAVDTLVPTTWALLYVLVLQIVL